MDVLAAAIGETEATKARSDNSEADPQVSAGVTFAQMSSSNSKVVLGTNVSMTASNKVPNSNTASNPSRAKSYDSRQVLRVSVPIKKSGKATPKSVPKSLPVTLKPSPRVSNAPVNKPVSLATTVASAPASAISQSANIVHKQVVIPRNVVTVPRQTVPNVPKQVPPVQSIISSNVQRTTVSSSISAASPAQTSRPPTGTIHITASGDGKHSRVVLPPHLMEMVKAGKVKVVMSKGGKVVPTKNVIVNASQAQQSGKASSDQTVSSQSSAVLSAPSIVKTTTLPTSLTIKVISSVSTQSSTLPVVPSASSVSTAGLISQQPARTNLSSISDASSDQTVTESSVTPPLEQTTTSSEQTASTTVDANDSLDMSDLLGDFAIPAAPSGDASSAIPSLLPETYPGAGGDNFTAPSGYASQPAAEESLEDLLMDFAVPDYQPSSSFSSFGQSNMDNETALSTSFNIDDFLSSPIKQEPMKQEPFSRMTGQTSILSRNGMPLGQAAGKIEPSGTHQVEIKQEVHTGSTSISHAKPVSVAAKLAMPKFLIKSASDATIKQSPKPIAVSVGSRFATSSRPQIITVKTPAALKKDIKPVVKPVLGRQVSGLMESKLPSVKQEGAITPRHVFSRAVVELPDRPESPVGVSLLPKAGVARMVQQVVPGRGSPVIVTPSGATRTILVRPPPAVSTPRPFVQPLIKAIPKVASEDNILAKALSVSGIDLSDVSPEPKQVTFTTQRLNQGALGVSQEAVSLQEIASEEVEELGQAETYAEYMPSKLTIGVKHPDAVVESSSLSSVEPPDVTYDVSLKDNLIRSGELSALQLESITYAGQRHDTLLASGERAGFLIGDGAGVGKGRTIAGIIYDNYLQGRKRAIWLSVSSDLRVDAERDLSDIGASKIDVHPLNKMKYAKISSTINGKVKKGVVFATYSSLIGESQAGGKYRTRLKQLLQWCGRHFEGVIIFDECHRAKNLMPSGSSKATKTGRTVLELQRKLPGARIIYASATGATEPRNMAYMTRLGLWGKGTPFEEVSDFLQAVERRGVGAMELVAMEMKGRGMYVARQLSFKGAGFNVEEVPLEDDYRDLYDDAVELWVEMRQKFSEAAGLLETDSKLGKSMWGQFWSAHQRFFKYMCLSAKVDHCVRISRDAVKAGKCVVIGLQSTGEARAREMAEEAGGDLMDFVSTAKGVLQTLIEKHFPAPDLAGGKDGGFNFSFLDLLGSDSDSNDSPAPQGAGKARDSSSSDSDSSDSSDSESEENNSDSDDNPFKGSGSDDDDNPWLTKSRKRKRPKESKKKKQKKKKSVAKKKRKKDPALDIDAMMDRALQQRGWLKGDNAKNTSGRVNFKGNSGARAAQMKRELLGRVERLGARLPPNTLDQLIDDLGGTDGVAEMTGRKTRVVSNDEGGVTYESRSASDVPLEILNLTEKQRFMDGQKLVAIISEAASSGISLHADRRACNQRRRVHITLELPWSADRAIQQFGRTHRSNQIHPPEYIFLISELAGERRFAATVAKRLESLGALTHGDRRASETRDLSQFNIDNKYGRSALERVMRSVLNIEPPLVPPPSNYSGEFFADVQESLMGVGLIVGDVDGSSMLDKDYNSINKFLNRLLGVRVECQNALFQYFTDTLSAVILQAKRHGRWDMGILDLGNSGEKVELVRVETFVRSGGSAGAVRVELHTVLVERGMTWAQAMALWQEHSGSRDGFYLPKHQQKKKSPTLAVAQANRASGSKGNKIVFTLYKPNAGKQSRHETLENLNSKYYKVSLQEARHLWEHHHAASSNMCIHTYWHNTCRTRAAGIQCEVGLRSRRYHVLCGSLLAVWGLVERVLNSSPHMLARMQLVRLRAHNGARIAGTLIPGTSVEMLRRALADGAESTSVTTPQEQAEEDDDDPMSMPLLF